MSDSVRPVPATWRDVPRSIWALGIVSLMMDVSSELIHSLLPVFLVTVVGASTATVGLIEGIAEATASMNKVFSGALSDRIGNRKLLTVIGYGLSALTKPVFPLASTTWEVLAARFADRIGKGIRDAPRDALIADITPAAVRGAGYGIRQALDTVGGVGGPMLAIALMALYANDFRAVFWWSVVPALLAVLVLIIAVQEPPGTRKAITSKWPIRKQELMRLPAAYWIVVAVGLVVTMARFSEAFLVLKAQAEGLALALIPLVFVWLNVVFALTAAPAGVLSDKIGRMKVLLTSLAALTFADLVLAFVPGLWGLAIGVGLWGLYMGLSQGLLSALVSDTAPEDLRGTSFGLFYLLTGGALLVASVLAGRLWQAYGSVATFVIGAAFSGIALVVTAAAIKTGLLSTSR